MKERSHPCICVICACGEVFAASVLQAHIIIQDFELLSDLEKYAKEGYEITVKDASEFRINCTCK